MSYHACHIHSISISDLVCFPLHNMGIKLAVKRIVGGKWGPCSGQACIGIDYLLVEDNLSYSLVFITITSSYFFFIFVFLVIESCWFSSR